ncbi:MAG: ABC transporter permease [Spirochaetes bacterium]|nr:ABC transporter permease [Spirochaetota bacterium]
MKLFLRRVGYFFLFLIFWQGTVMVLGIKEFIIPTPLKTLSHIFHPTLAAKYQWPLHVQATLMEIMLSFLITAVAGNLVALLISWSRALKVLITPIIVFFNSLPKIALAPLFLLWFGYGLLPNTLIAVLVAFFPIVINTSTGLEQVDEDLLNLVRYLGATKGQIFVKIKIPNALPYIFSGFKISATMCVVGSIVGEFIASDKGLGYLLKDAQAFIDTPTMFACLLLISLLGILFFGVLSILESRILYWMPQSSVGGQR